MASLAVIHSFDKSGGGRHNPLPDRFNLVMVILLLIGGDFPLDLIAAELLPNHYLSLPLPRPSDQTLEIQGQLPKQAPAINLPILQRPGGENLAEQNVLQFTPREYQFIGNSVFKAAELRQLIRQFLNTPVNSIDLEEMRLILTNHYVSHGYITSSALFPEQDLSSGVLNIQIKEGTLDYINVINKAGRLNNTYIKQRVQTRDDGPLHLSSLQDNLFELQQNPRIRWLNASLLPSDSRGTSVLDLEVQEARAYRLDLDINNDGPVTLDEKQAVLAFKHINLTGWGDTLAAKINRGEGFLAAELYYDYPISTDDTLVYAAIRHADASHQPDPPHLNDLSNTDYSLTSGLKTPLLHTANERFELDVNFNYKSAVSSFAYEGCQSGFETPIFETETLNQEINVAAIRFGQSLQQHQDDHFFSLRHTLSIGVKAFNATDCPGSEADTRFTSWLWQFLLAHRFSPYKLQTVVRGDYQFSQYHLLATEKYAMGGANSVRGYHENALVRDNGLLLSAELRLPFRLRAVNTGSLQAVTFVDAGQGWDSQGERNKQTLSSTGIGLRWQSISQNLLEIYLAARLHDRDPGTASDSSLQGQGIHLRFQWNLL